MVKSNEVKIPEIDSIEQAEDFLSDYEEGKYQLYLPGDSDDKNVKGLVFNYGLKRHFLSCLKLYTALRQKVSPTPSSANGREKMTPKQYNDLFPLLKVKQNHRSRILQGSVVRRGVYLGDKACILPSFINLGAYIGDGSTVDAESTIGSCAYIGSNVHIASGTTIGGVVEPMNQVGVYIGDRSFIGANSSISEGVVIDDDVIVGAGTHITASTHIVNGETGEEMKRSYVPANSLCVNGGYRKNDYVSIQCAVILARQNRRKFMNEECH